MNAPLFQLPAHDPGQRIHFRFSQVRHLKAGGVQLIPGAHGADDGHAGGVAMGHQRQLGAHGVYCVHHIIVLVKGKIRRRFRQKEAVVLGDLGRRIDV